MSDNAHQNPNSVEITTIDMGASLKFWVDQAELGMNACASWMEKSKELESSVARKSAEDSLKEQPAWSNGSLDS